MSNTLRTAAVLFSLAFPLIGSAQAQTAAQPAPAVPQVGQPEPPASAVEAGRQLVIASGMARSFEPMVPQLSGQIVPMLTKTRPELKANLTATLDQLQPEFKKKGEEMNTLAGKIYARSMSEQELRDAAAFFNSPVGKKYVQVQPIMLDQLVVGMQAWTQDLSDLHDAAHPRRDEEKGPGFLTGGTRALDDFDVDLFVIGGGSGGVRAARIAAGHGARVALAEDYRLGGTCVIRGCVPKKLFAYASRFADDFADAEGFGWTVPTPTFSWGKLVAAKEAEVSRLSAIYRGLLDRSGVAIHECRATVADPHHVMLATGAVVSARHILVATGGRPEFRPQIPGIDLAISSNEIFDLPAFPRRLLAIGAGYIALEFASVFARLGSEVTVAFRGDKILRGFDEDMRDGLTAALEHAGIAIRPHLLPIKIDRGTDGLDVTMSDGSTLVVDQVLVATGRYAHTQGLGLAEAGVELRGEGEIVVDRFSTTCIPSIHAVGDVTNRINLTPVAVREGHALADTLFGTRPTAVDHVNVASAVFTTPEIGTVGLTEEQARVQFGVVDIYKTSFRPMKAVLSGRDERTIMKIIVDGETDRVLGVHILGHDAGEMAQLVGIAVHMGATKADFDATMAVHPTAAEELVTLRTRTARYEQASTASDLATASV